MNHEYLFLLSWTLSGGLSWDARTGGGNVADIEVLAGMANPWLLQTLQKQRFRPNIVFCDFVDPYLCRVIVAQSPQT